MRSQVPLLAGLRIVVPSIRSLADFVRGGSSFLSSVVANLMDIASDDGSESWCSVEILGCGFLYGRGHYDRSSLR